MTSFGRLRNKRYRQGFYLRIMRLTLFLLMVLPCLAGAQLDKPKDLPPGTVQLNDTLYFDQHELNNFSWLEYMFWNKRIFGPQSDEYISTLPDTTVWSSLNDSLWCYELLTDIYLRHPSYRDHPVTGISKDQATAYSIWRNDRVFEYLLIKEGLIEYDTAQDKASHFTIDHYFDGSFTGSRPAAGNYYVPAYRLPTDLDLKFAKAHNEARMERFRRKLRKKGDFCDEREEPYIFADWIQCGTFEMDGMTGSSTLEPFGTKECDCKKDVLYFLIGNLPEITKASTQTPHFVTFRNAFVWKKVVVE